MKDYLAQVEKLGKDAADCAVIRDLAKEPAKREIGLLTIPRPLQTRFRWQCSNERPEQRE